MKKSILFLCVFIYALSSCKKEEIAPPALPIVSFNIIGDNKPAPCEVSFVNNSENANTYVWDFGDGSSSTEKNPKHTYNSKNDYTVKLTATGEGGTKSSTQVVKINDFLPVGSIIQDKYIIEAGETVTFTTIAFGTVDWDFTIQSSKLTTVSVKYTSVGIYPLVLTVTNLDGIKAEYYSTVTVGERYLTSVEVKKISFTDPDGQIWDGGLLGDGTGPDLFFKMGVNEEFVSGVISNVTQKQITDGLVLWFANVPFPKLASNNEFKFLLYDKDGTTNEYMVGWKFNPYLYPKNYETGEGKLILKDNSDKYEIVFNFMVLPSGGK